MFVGSSNEKGTFFEADIPLTEPFDITKLQLSYDDVDGNEVINSVYYDDESIGSVEYDAMHDILKDLFYVDCTELYFAGREKC